MPFLRVLRDKRGYETTYLMHWFQEGPRQRSRVLYVFRTPGGARVGRVPLEQSVMRQLEERYPDIAFDWRDVLEQQQIIEAAPDMRRRRPRRDEKEGPGDAGPPKPAGPAPPAAAARPPIPAALEGTTPDEQVAFLERTYPAVRDRVAQLVDPARRQALGALADRLDPSGWTDGDAIAAGLRQAAEALERLSRVFVRRRRRGKRRVTSPTGEVEAEGAGAPEPEPENDPS